jgi:hypothetical protein
MNLRLYPPAEYPLGHSDLASSLNNLGALLDEVGVTEPVKIELSEPESLRA